MSDQKKPLNEGYQPRGYQPSPEKHKGGYQPPKTEGTPKLPPKKP